MPAPQYGALGASYTVARGLQGISLISIIGMTANFIAQMVSSKTNPPNVLIGTISVTCIAVLYCAISYILFWDRHLPFLVATGLDSALLIAVIVVAVTIGKPLSYLDCATLSKDGGSAQAFLSSVGTNMGKVDYFVWAGADSLTCYEMKSIWGLSIALCILFALSAAMSALLWKRTRGGFTDLEK
ncbi:hypothetical protein ACLOAV_009465 [Pseudogymnoascus australis]